MVQKIYMNSPVFLQNILLNFYAYRRKKKFRKNKFYFNAIETIKMLENGEKDIIEFQNDRLTEMLKHCLLNVPYYKKKYKHLLKEEFKIEDLEDFEILSKQEVKSNWSQFQYHKINNVFITNTSGTSGSSLNLRISENCTGFERAGIEIYRGRLGYKDGDKIASFIGRKIMKNDITKPPFWRFNYVDNQLIFSNWHVSDENLPHYIKKLNDFAPDYIHGYPSFLYLIAEYAKRNNLAIKSPKGIFTSSETLFNYQRELIESILGAKILDRYGSAEQLVAITQCKLGEYLIKGIA